MGFLESFENDHYEFIDRMLKKRGLKRYKSGEWEVHGPHPGMNYQVYVGQAYIPKDPTAQCICKHGRKQPNCKFHNQDIWVSIYPRRVYQFDGIYGEWWKITSEDLIPVKKKTD